MHHMFIVGFFLQKNWKEALIGNYKASLGFFIRPNITELVSIDSSVEVQIWIVRFSEISKYCELLQYLPSFLITNTK